MENHRSRVCDNNVSSSVKKKKFLSIYQILSKIILAILAISYGSNFFQLKNANSTLKNSVAGLEASVNQSCAVRACKPICQFHRAAVPKNSVGKIARESFFYPKLYDFRPNATYVLDYYSPTSNSNLDLFLYYWRSARDESSGNVIIGNDIINIDSNGNRNWHIIPVIIRLEVHARIYFIQFIMWRLIFSME